MTGRRGKTRSLLFCCFEVTKKYMEVLMKLLECHKGSVLTPSRQMASYLSIPLLSQWAGGRACYRPECALSIPAYSSSGLQGLQCSHCPLE